MRGKANAFAGVLIAIAAAAAAIAGAEAAGPPTGDQSGPTEHSPFNGTLSNSDINNLADYADRARRLTQDMSPAEKTKAADAAKAASAKLVTALQMSCDVADAALAGIGTAKNDAGKELKVNIYEVACGNGGGAYILYSREPDPPFGFSCFFAGALNDAQKKEGKKADFQCSLPANKDLKNVASAILSHAGITCDVTAANWFGQNVKGQIEFNEAACADRTGYLIVSSLPGSAPWMQVMSCADAAKKGIKCELTDAGPVAEPVTLDTLKAALAQNGISCPDMKMRVIGQESIKKRYVVEYLCPASGGVAYVPMQGNANKFESISCTDAAKRKLACTLAKS